MKALFPLTLCVALFHFLDIAHATESKVVTLTILSFGNVCAASSNGQGQGCAGLYTLLEKERQKTDYHLTVMTGDFLFPSIFSMLDQGVRRVELMHALGVDLAVLGNHEFDLGPEVLKERIAESKFQWLGANVFDTHCQNFTGTKQAVVIDLDGIKVGFFGLITLETPLISSTHRKVYFTPTAVTAKQMVNQLKAEGAEVVIALTHLLIEEDRQLAAEVPEIDLILGGHDREPSNWYNGKTFIHKSGKNAHFLSKTHLVIDRDEATSKVKVYPSCEIIANHDVLLDDLIAACVRDEEACLDSAQEVIATLDCSLDSVADTLRYQESTMGNLIADALRDACQADIAMISGGILRGDRIYEQGSELTLKDLLIELPFSNMCYLVEIVGEDILDALENGLSRIEEQAGCFPQVSGMNYAFNPSHPPGKRVISVEIKGIPLDKKAFYRVATVDYLYHGGDGYNSFKKGKLLIGFAQQMELVTCVAEYCKTLQRIDTVIGHRIVCLDASKHLDQNFLQQSGVVVH